ncbi:reverse transcriptase domain-containing protein [Tanacetum coccineum]
MLIEVGKFTFPADFVIHEIEEDSKVPLILGRSFLHSADAVIRVKHKQFNLGVGTERMIFNIDFVMKHSYSNDDTCFSIDVIDKILEEDFDALLDEGSKILYSIEGTLLEEEIFAKFNEFIAMTADENSDSEYDSEEPPFEKITINTDYKIKTSLEEPPIDLKLKPLPDNLEYVFLEEPSFLPVIISSQLSKEKKNKLVFVLKNTRKLLLGKQQTFLVFAHHSASTRYNFWMTRNPLSKNKEVLRRMPFGLCNAPATFQRCMLAIFHDMIEESIEVFMDDFSIFGNSLDKCLNNLDKMLQRCKDAHLVLNWEKCYFMVKEGIVLGQKVSGAGLEVDKAKINIISKLPPHTNIKETKDRKGTENVAADHLSRIENDKSSDDSDVDDNFPGETLMEINTKDEPWFADFANYLVVDIIPKGITYQQKNKFFSDLKHYFSGGNPCFTYFSLKIWKIMKYVHE